MRAVAAFLLGCAIGYLLRAPKPKAEPKQKRGWWYTFNGVPVYVSEDWTAWYG